MAQEREAAPPNSWRITWPCSTKRERACSDERDGSTATAEQFIQLEQIKRYSETCAKSTCIIGSVPVVVGGK